MRLSCYSDERGDGLLVVARIAEQLQIAERIGVAGDVVDFFPGRTTELACSTGPFNDFASCAWRNPARLLVVAAPENVGQPDLDCLPDV